MKKIKSITLIYIFLFLILLLVILTIYHCPLKYIFGISCPTCGLTRAMIYFFKMDFLNAFHYHAFWPVVVVGSILYILYITKIIKINQKKTILILCIIICLLNLIYYFWRLFNNSDIVYFDFTESLIYKIITLFFL